MKNIKNVKIIGTGSYVPAKVLTNEDLEKMVETNHEWIITRTGIAERRIAEDNETTSDIAAKAALKALKDSNIKPEEIDLIIVATNSPDMIFPATACLVQKRIKAVNAATFDLQAGCTGAVYALITAWQYIATGFYDNVLVIGADTLSKFVDWTDRNTCILFGDGAGAAVLKADQEKGIFSGCLTGDGSYDDLIPHQANIRIISALTRVLKIKKDKVFVNLNKYGNTSAASVMIALDEAVKEGKIKNGDIVALAAFGAGLTSGAIVLKWI